MSSLLALLLVSVSSLSCGGSRLHVDPQQVPISCSWEFEDRVSSVLENLGVASASTFFPRGEARRQSRRYPGSVCPDIAVKLAVGAILADRAPEALGTVGAEIGGGECDAECYFNRRSSLFGIVADGGSPIANQLLPATPDGDSLRDSWVFFLSVPDLSEHGYWALVARNGSSIRVRSKN